MLTKLSDCADDELAGDTEESVQPMTVKRYVLVALRSTSERGRAVPTPAVLVSSGLPK